MIIYSPKYRSSQLPRMNNTFQDLTQAVSPTAYSHPNNCLHRLFESQVKLTPNAIALTFERQQLTYRELNQRANQLANYLIGLEEMPEIIAIYLERSPWSIIAILAILKAGAACLPLNVKDNIEYINYVLKDARVNLCITQENLASKIALEDNQKVFLDTQWSAINALSTEDLVNYNTSQDLAYVIYTSSINKPKGVAIEHGAVINLAKALSRDIDRHYSPQLKISFHNHTNVKVALKQIIQLLNGHNIYIGSEAVELDLELMLEYIAENELDIFDCNPTYLKLLIAAGLLDLEESLQAILVSGEAIDVDTWKLLKNKQKIDFYNLYGAIECTIHAAISPISATQNIPTIGRSLLNTQIYILDENLQAVPIGVTGELYIGGAQIARGYLNNPELTAENFIINPFDVFKKSRLYKTGDKGRYLPKGNIEYLGKIE